MSKLVILGGTGDLKVSWDIGNEKEIAVAKEIFERRTKEGWTAFREKYGSKGEKIKIFDPEAERIVLVPQISGGSQ
jgi:hypothetical protein